MRRSLLLLIALSVVFPIGCKRTNLGEKVSLKVDAWVNLMPTIGEVEKDRGKLLISVSGLKGKYDLKKIVLWNTSGDSLGVFNLEPLEVEGRFVADKLPLKEGERIYGKVVLEFKEKVYTLSIDTVEVKAVH